MAFKRSAVRSRLSPPKWLFGQELPKHRKHYVSGAFSFFGESLDFLWKQFTTYSCRKWNFTYWKFATFSSHKEKKNCACALLRSINGCVIGRSAPGLLAPQHIVGRRGLADMRPVVSLVAKCLPLMIKIRDNAPA